jgi:hypothetical protein
MVVLLAYWLHRAACELSMSPSSLEEKGKVKKVSEWMTRDG